MKPRRTFLEGLWRRTQSDINAKESGRVSAEDSRRRIIHYYDEYDVSEKSANSLLLKVINPWIWLVISSPKNEIDEYVDQIKLGAERGGWQKVLENSDTLHFCLGNNIELVVKRVKRFVEDEINNRKFPSNYEHLEIEIRLKDKKQSDELRGHAWAVLKSGFRTKDTRGNPEIITHLRNLEKYLPMQVELGCGPSIEAGIPPLHYLHQVYYVSDPSSGKFIFGAQKDLLLLDILSNIGSFYQKASLSYFKALTSNPTPFYYLLQKLHTSGVVVGDVITNNFDSYCNYLDVPETYVRRYDEVHITPLIDFHPKAKSLLVVGSHADRRRIQHAARRQGLKVIYVDPEGYRLDGGAFVSFPLESAQDNDMLFRGTADDFERAWLATFTT